MTGTSEKPRRQGNLSRGFSLALEGKGMPGNRPDQLPTEVPVCGLRA